MARLPSARALLRQDRSRRTRAKLVEAARALLVTRGFDETTVADICAAAGVAKGTFFFYFSRKEDVLLELVAVGGERIQVWLKEQLATDSPTEVVLRALVQTFAARMRLVPPLLLQQILQELLQSGERWRLVRGDRFDLAAGVTAVFVRAQLRGEVPPELDAEELGDLVTIAAAQGAVRWIGGRRAEMPLEDVLWQRVAIILRGATR